MALKDIKAANNAKTELAQAISPTDTAFIAKDSAKFPDAPFRVTVDNEIMEVGAINKSTNTFSNITRGEENTISTSHELGSSVENRWTAGTLQVMLDNIGMTYEQLGIIATPRGVITMWSGSTETVPAGWALCDGNNSTPDLRNRFIVGAGAKFNSGNIGGEENVTLTTEQLPAHTHGKGTLTGNTAGRHAHICYKTESEYGDLTNATAGHYGSHEVTTSTAGEHSHSISGNTASVGSGQAHNNMPPYYALCFIMKM